MSYETMIDAEIEQLMDEEAPIESGMVEIDQQVLMRHRASLVVTRDLLRKVLAYIDRNFREETSADGKLHSPALDAARKAVQS